MFDYQRWSSWLEAEGIRLQSQGFDVRFNRADGTTKPGSSLGASRDNVIGSFAIWITGEADYDITDGQGKDIQPGKKWGMRLSDQSFVKAFEEFRARLSEKR